MKILLIDDEPSVLSMVEKMLRFDGHEVVPANDGEEGMRLLAEEADIELVITDLIMPNKEGIETIMEIRQVQPNVKILAMSGGGRGGANTYLSAAKSIGADATLSKPFLRQDLIDAVNNLKTKD